MEKESVKKFDLEAAFKALDEIEIPQTKGIKANRVDLKERFGHKPATETLVEDYYDVSSTEDLEDAKEERDGEIAKAKLARIEKIVDLNAESPEDLLPSYVGKVIMQCPQCMTLFYKNQEDIEPSDENPDVVNLNEPCQHCGNTSGYTLIGKVGAVSEDEADKYDETETPAEENELDLDFNDGTEEVDAEGTGEGAEEMSDKEQEEEPSDEASSDEDLNLDEVSEEEPEKEKKEESLKESKTTKQRLTVVEPGYQYKDEDGNLYTLYGEELEEDDTGIVYDWEFVDDENGDIYIKKEIAEESLNLSKEASENESEHKSENLTLNEEIDKDLDEKLKAHNDYIAYLQQMIKQEEKALKKAENDEIKAAIQRRLDAFNADLEAALPDAVKAEAPVEELAEEPAADENKTEEKLENLALKESTESEIDSIIASWDANESLKESLNESAKEKYKAVISWSGIFCGDKRSYKNDITYVFDHEPTEQEIIDRFENDENIVRLKNWNVNNVRKEVRDFMNGTHANNDGWEDIKITGYKIIKEVAKSLDITSSSIDESLKEYWWEDNDSMNWSDKEPLVYSCYYNSKLLGYLEYQYMGQEEYPTTIRADIIKHFKLPKGYNPKEISWQYVENDPLDETKPLVKVNESLTEESNLDRLLDSDEFKTPVSEEEIDAARREVAEESLEEKCGKQKITEESEVEDNTDDDATAPTIYHLFLDDKEVYKSESIPLDKALSEITAYIKKLTPDQKKSFSLSWEFDESGYHNKPIYDNDGNIVGSRNDWIEVDGDVIVGVFSEAECKEYGYAFPEDRFVVNVDYAGDAIRKAFDTDVTANLKEEKEDDDDDDEEDEIEEPEFNEDDIDELDECSLNKHIDEYLKEVYSNVKSYKTTDCKLKEGKLIVEGKISFNSGKEKLTMFEFLPAYCEGNLFFEGYNKDFSKDKAFTLNCSINESKTLVTESFGYKYKINENLVKGLK